MAVIYSTPIQFVIEYRPDKRGVIRYNQYLQDTSWKLSCWTIKRVSEIDTSSQEMVFAKWISHTRIFHSSKHATEHTDRLEEKKYIINTIELFMLVTYFVIVWKIHSNAYNVEQHSFKKWSHLWEMIMAAFSTTMNKKFKVKCNYQFSST